MNARQVAKLNMFRATLNHCNDNTAIVLTIPAFATTVTVLNEKVSTIISTAQQEDLVIKGVTVEKRAAKKTLCQLAADIAAPIFALAAATENHILKQAVRFTHSDLLKTKDDILAPRCQNIKDAGTEHLASLAPYGLTAASLTALQAAIDHFQEKVAKPRNSTAQKMTTREHLKMLVKEAETVLKEQMDKTVVGFKAAHPDFVATYKTNRSIMDPKQTTTTLKGTIINAKDKSPVSAATVVVVENDTKIFTGEKSVYELKPVPPGMYTLNVSAPGYKNKKVKEVTVKKGQITTLDIALEPV